MAIENVCHIRLLIEIKINIIIYLIKKYVISTVDTIQEITKNLFNETIKFIMKKA